MKWRSSSLDWLKDNFDGSTKGNSSGLGCGGVLRDHYSRVVDVVAIPFGHSTSHETEAAMTLYTIRLTWNVDI